MPDTPTPLPDGLDWDAAEHRPMVIVGTGPAYASIGTTRPSVSRPGWKTRPYP